MNPVEYVSQVCFPFLLVVVLALVMGDSTVEAASFAPSLSHRGQVVSIAQTHNHWSGRCQRFAASSDASDDDAKRLLEEAERLRGEIADFQKGKDLVEQAEREEKEAEEAAKRDVRMRYSTEVPILKGDGSTVMERVDFPPRIKGGKSRILSLEASLPLGIILGEHEDIPGATRVDEVASDSNGEVAGVMNGDILRACTACQVTMETPTWQLLAGGIGQPKTKRFMFSTDGRPFEEVMDAVGSNRMDPEERPVWLVLERAEP